jgi:hypothetical protein
MAVGPIITLGLKYTPSLIVTLGYGIGAYVAPVVSTQQYSGGWFPTEGRRKTRKQIHAERVRLGILPADIVEAAKVVAEKAAEEGDPVQVYKQNRDSLNAKFMQELHVTHWLPDYGRAIQAQIAIIEQDDEDILLLL